jgi:hypothetical protein
MQRSAIREWRLTPLDFLPNSHAQTMSDSALYEWLAGGWYQLQ